MEKTQKGHLLFVTWGEGLVGVIPKKHHHTVLVLQPNENTGPHFTLHFVATWVCAAVNLNPFHSLSCFVVVVVGAPPHTHTSSSAACNVSTTTTTKLRGLDKDSSPLFWGQKLMPSIPNLRSIFPTFHDIYIYIYINMIGWRGPPLFYPFGNILIHVLPI